MSQATSLEDLLERVESEYETADGRLVRICRDARGDCWVIDRAERIVSLAEFGTAYDFRARAICDRERVAVLRAIVGWAKAVTGRIAGTLPHAAVRAARA
jgi:hypothetical protein